VSKKEEEETPKSSLQIIASYKYKNIFYSFLYLNDDDDDDERKMLKKFTL